MRCAKRSREANFAVIESSCLRLHAGFDDRIMHAATIIRHGWVRHALNSAAREGVGGGIFKFPFDDGRHFGGLAVSSFAALQCLYSPEAIQFALAWVDVEAVGTVGKRIPAVFVILVLADDSFKNSARSGEKSSIQTAFVVMRVQMHPHTRRPLRRLSRCDGRTDSDGSHEGKSHTSPLTAFGLLC